MSIVAALPVFWNTIQPKAHSRASFHWNLPDNMQPKPLLCFPSSPRSLDHRKEKTISAAIKGSVVHP